MELAGSTGAGTPPTVLGITGGFATGKSTVAELLRARGAVVLSADEAARDLTAAGSPINARIADEIGPQYVRSDGTLDRPALAARIFADASARRALDRITHPAILERLREGIAAARAAQPPPRLIVVEAPLLYEAGMESWFDRILVVAAQPEQQAARLAARSGLTAEEARLRIAVQMPLAEKIARADDVLWNDSTLGSLADNLDRLLANWRIDLSARPSGD